MAAHYFEPFRRRCIRNRCVCGYFLPFPLVECILVVPGSVHDADMLSIDDWEGRRENASHTIIYHFHYQCHDHYHYHHDHHYHHHHYPTPPLSSSPLPTTIFGLSYPRRPGSGGPSPDRVRTWIQRPRGDYLALGPLLTRAGTSSRQSDMRRGGGNGGAIRRLAAVRGDVWAHSISDCRFCGLQAIWSQPDLDTMGGVSR
jgi:hypothetical protein